jgi:hypothetical protein
MSYPLDLNMLCKMDYVQEKDDKGRTMIRKVGMAPVQRQGMEYEFTIVGDMDLEHNFVVTKSRCDLVADKVVRKPDGKFFKKILDWLNSGEPALPKAEITSAHLGDDRPGENAWNAWFTLADQANALGLDVPDTDPDIAVGALRQLYAELKSQVRAAEAPRSEEPRYVE